MSVKALLAAVLESPDDDLPRLAYADWLEEHGGEAERSRAGLIRAQVELETLGEDDPRRPALEAQEAEALGRLGPAQWEAELHQEAIHEAEHRRGFIERVAMMLYDAPGVGRMMGRAPIRDVELIGEGSFAPLARWPHPERLRRLAVTETEGDANLGVLAGFRRFAGLKELKVSDCLAGDEFPWRLQRVGSWPKLEAVDLTNNALGVGGCYDLIASPWVAGVRTLLLTNNALSDEDIDELLLQPGLARLTAFGISGHESSDAAVRAIAECPHLANLRRLVLCEAAMEPAGLRALATSPHLGGVTDLDVSGSMIHGARGVAHLKRDANFQRLTTLDLGRCPVGQFGARQLAEWEGLAGLRVLKLNNAELGDRGLVELLKAPWLPSLRHLELFHNELTDAGVTALAGCEKLGRLRELVLGNNRWDVAGAEALARSPHLGRLKRLGLTMGSGSESERARAVVVGRFGGRVRYW